MVYGTSYFPTRGDAYKYYSAQGVFSFQVDNKITDGEINIGKPPGYLGTMPEPSCRMIRVDRSGGLSPKM